MKATTTQAEVEFKPIELKITIESKRELEFLWELFNCSGVKHSKFLLENGRRFNDFGSDQCRSFSYPIWEELHKHL